MAGANGFYENVGENEYRKGKFRIHAGQAADGQAVLKHEFPRFSNRIWGWKEIPKELTKSNMEWEKEPVRMKAKDLFNIRFRMVTTREV